MCPEIDYINKVLHHFDISPSWLVRQMNLNPQKSRLWSKQNLDYLLGVAKEITTKTYREIRTVLDKYNFTINDGGLCKTLGDEVAGISSESSHLIAATIKSLEDGALDEEERCSILIEVEHMQKILNEIKLLLKSE